MKTRDERLLRADDRLGFRKKWGRILLEDQVLRVFFTVLRGGICGSVVRVFSPVHGSIDQSKDRLTWVRNSIYFNDNDDYLVVASSFTTMLLGIGSNVGVYFKQRTSTMLTSTVKAAQKRTRANLLKEGRPISCVSGGDEGKWMLGCVQKIRRRLGMKWGLSRQSIDLQLKPHVKYGKIEYSQPSVRGDFWALSVDILVFASPTGYMLTSSGFPLLNWGIFYKFL